MSWLAIGAALLITGALPAIALLRWLRIRKTPRNVALAIWLPLLPWLAAEVYFQYLWSESDSFGWLSRNFARRHYHADGFGLRDSGLPLASDRPNVLVVGDSLAFGAGLAEVGDRFGNRLRALLPSAHVVVLSSIGGGPLQQTALVRRFTAGSGKVAAAVLSYTSNDILDAAPRDYAAPPAGRSAWRPWFERIELLRHFYHRVRISPAAYDAYLRGRVADAFADPEIFARHAAQLRELAAAASRGGEAPLWLLLWPDLTRMQRDASEIAIAELARAQGWRALELTPLLTAHPSAELVVSRRDRHPNALAHRLVAERLAQDLRRAPALAP